MCTQNVTHPDCLVGGDLIALPLATVSGRLTADRDTCPIRLWLEGEREQQYPGARKRAMDAQSD